MTDCKSLVDPKVTTAPVLYLPAGMETPSAVATAHQQCNVEIKQLPRKITHIGDVRVADIPEEGLLYLPNRYVVPGGRFNEMYGWDSYFIILGLVEDKRTDLAQDMVENFFFEIENYGAILNANRTYYFTRSQPPFLTSMIREVYEHPAQALISQKRGSPKPTATLNATTTSGPRRSIKPETPASPAITTSAKAPSPRWPTTATITLTSFAGCSPIPTSTPTTSSMPLRIQAPHEAAALAKISCDITTSKVCARAHVDGHRLTAGFYSGDRAMRESGFDPSFRFGPFSGSTENYAPICLNSLLYKYERDMAHFATLLGRPAEAAEWQRRAAARREAINKYLWNPTQGMFYDYDFTTQKQSTYNYITAFYPLWAQLATPQQATALEHHLSLFEHDGGLAMSDTNSGTQWDLPFGWAPTTWLAIKGLAQYGFTADASRTATKFSQTILQNFLADGTIREKYNVVSGSANVAIATGYKSNVVGFGWTNGVYLQMQDLLTHQSKQAATPKQSH